MNEYDMWPGINDALHITGQNGTYPIPVNGIFVTDGDKELSPIVASAFQRCNMRLIDTTEHGRLLRRNKIFICYNFKGINDKKAETY
ncbi:MAG: hypothetical protein HQK96_21660 [Nitrospirae bacterium]|nr:hypothetical protein [Nitrospirota bacterium]